VDVGLAVVADPQTAKLVEPGKCAIRYPPLPAQAPAMHGAAQGQRRHDMPRPIG
jgi:hypothetical protein